VAVLVPTTVLCVQHGRTFTERFADFPVCIEVLNRFKSPSQASRITELARAGQVDILIGTHRLLSADVGFRDLGLVIIDEEQRFGVEHKERLKKLRVNVDVLTMTATPIPRTLHMALLGIRDISSLRTPPLDRRSIVTSITAFSPQLIRQAVARELNRRGQVFFVHNRVKTIDKRTHQLRRILEDGLGRVRMAVVHGQMVKSRLETAMIDFVNGRIDVLVCTTIIESGLDIPNANTIFIDDADRFGLAELHQLRGRVGRYKHRAYAYMLLPSARPVSPVAAKRLKAIEDYSYLGAGFKIALRDLEIRGAGNILGREQSGHIHLVGYQLYCQLLAAAARQARGLAADQPPTAVVDLGFSGCIPASYISSDRHRMDMYRRIAFACDTDDLARIGRQAEDMYGPVPGQMRMLLDVAELKIMAARRNVASLVAAGGDLLVSFNRGGGGEAKSLVSRVGPRVTAAVKDDGSVSLRLPQAYGEPSTLAALTRKLLG
jgi:transcription-repair coupling factor (superfamily II helicase)